MRKNLYLMKGSTSKYLGSLLSSVGETKKLIINKIFERAKIKM